MTATSLSRVERADAPSYSPVAPANAARVPLVVDVDGTLIKTDLLYEAALQMAGRSPFEIWRLALWLRGGKAALKTELAARVDPGVATIPLREEVVALIRSAQAEDRPVYLASASDRRYVQALADRLGGLSGVFATGDGVNLAGRNKAERLVAEFGEGGFDYVGDQPVDFAVWDAARDVLVLSHSNAFERRVLASYPDARVVARPRPNLRAYAKALRPHQWAKNLLVLLPLIAGHMFAIGPILSALAAFACFSMAASSAYLINDLLDLRGDRDHPRKRKRPFASGDVPLHHGIILAAVLMTGAFALSAALPLRFVGTLALYLGATLAYSFVLKRKVMVDVVTLGGLYTLRVLGGVGAVGAVQSPWLLMFCLFFFLSLAVVKRCSELTAKEAAGETAPIGRGYRLEDLRVLFPLGAAAGYGAILVVTLYLSSEEIRTLYSHPTRMWLICPLLLYWISRVLILSNRDEMHDDPVVFALTDRVSWVVGACVAFVIAASL